MHCSLCYLPTDELVDCSGDNCRVQACADCRTPAGECLECADERQRYRRPPNWQALIRYLRSQAAWWDGEIASATQRLKGDPEHITATYRGLAGGLRVAANCIARELGDEALLLPIEGGTDA